MVPVERQYRSESSAEIGVSCESCLSFARLLCSPRGMPTAVEPTHSPQWDLAARHT